VNWYKMAEAAVTVTPAEFGAMTREEKIVLARNPSISPDTQRLFFTEDYEGKRGDQYGILWRLALNPSIIPEVQRLFFTEEYEGKSSCLGRLALRKSIAPEVQLLFFTESYEGKWDVLLRLAINNPYMMTQETQRLFITESYQGKSEILTFLARNENFLLDSTPYEWLLMRKSAKGSAKLLVLSKRLKQLVGVP